MSTNTTPNQPLEKPPVQITRYEGQRIKINGPCEIEIHEVRGGKVRVFVLADPEVYVARSEHYDPAFEDMTPAERRLEGQRRREERQLAAAANLQAAEPVDAATV